MRRAVRPHRRAGVVALVSVVLFALMGTTAASASSLTITTRLRPYNAGPARCTSQTVQVTTPAGGATNKLVVSGLDTALCAGVAFSVVLYDPKLSSTWSAAQITSASGTVTAASLTLTTPATFTPKVAYLPYVLMGGWQIPATFVPGTPSTVRTMTMKESQHGKCLTVQSTPIVDGTPVVLSTCVTGTVPATQKWTQMSDGTLRAGGLCLTVPATVAADVIPLQVKTCVGGANQQWTPDSTHTDTGTFQWVSGMWWTPDPTTNGCLDNEGESAADGTRQILYHCINNHGNQEWILT